MSSGTHIFGCLLEGACNIRLDNGLEKILTNGEIFYDALG
jgi:hypothetical protein